MNLDELITHHQLQALTTRYGSLLDAGDFPGTAQLFTADAELEITTLNETFAGREAIAAYFAQRAQHSPPAQETGRRHHFSCHVLEQSDPDSARGTLNYLVVAHAGLVAWGHYEDTYHRVTDGSWQFARRRIIPAAPPTVR